MEFTLTRNWWMLALRGILAIAFGVAAFFWPGLLWLAVVYTFAVYALIDGVFAIAAAVTGHGPGQQWWALLIEGLFGIAVGVLAFLWPGVTELVLLWFIAGWAIGTGILEIVVAIRLRNYIQGEWLLALSGVLSVLLGLALAIAPVAGLLVIAWWIGAYAIAFGVLLLVLAFQLRSWQHRHGPMRRHALIR